MATSVSPFTPCARSPSLTSPTWAISSAPRTRHSSSRRANLGKTIEVVTKQGELFDAYVSIDPQTNELLALRADRVSVPKEIKGVTLSDQ